MIVKKYEIAIIIFLTTLTIYVAYRCTPAETSMAAKHKKAIYEAEYNAALEQCKILAEKATSEVLWYNNGDEFYCTILYSTDLSESFNSVLLPYYTSLKK